MLTYRKYGHACFKIVCQFNQMLDSILVIEVSPSLTDNWNQDDFKKGRGSSALCNRRIKQNICGPQCGPKTQELEKKLLFHPTNPLGGLS